MRSGQPISLATRSTNGRHESQDSRRKIHQEPDDAEQTEMETHWTNTVDSEVSYWLGQGIYQSQSRKQSHGVSIFRIPPEVKVLHERNFDPDLMVLGLFSGVDFTARSRNAKNFKLEIVCAFIDVLNGPEAFGQALSLDEGSLEDGNSIPEDGSSRWTWEELQSFVVQDPSELQYHYDLNESELKSPQIIRRVLTLDAVFLCIYLYTYLSDKLRRSTSGDKKWSGTENPFFDPFFDIVLEKSSTFHNRIVDDISKLENQIPLSMIARVLELIHGTRHPDSGRGESRQNLIREDLHTICQNWILLHEKSLPGICTSDWDSEDLQFGRRQLGGCDHLLACLCRAPGLFADRSPHSAKESRIGIKDLPHPSWPTHDSMQDSSCLPSACTMRDSGILFQGKGRGKGLVPVFERGFLNLSATLYIPSFCLLPNTETVWRNMVAFLRESTGNSRAIRQESMEFIFFIRFIDEIVETEKDVSLLRKGSHGVIQKNLLGTNQQVADLINTVVRHDIPDIKRYDESQEWLDLRHSMNQFLKERRRIALLEWLRHNFGKPWLVVSLLAGLSIILLSFLQTLYTMLSYYQPSPQN